MAIATTRCGSSGRSSSAAASRTLPVPSSTARTSSADRRRSASSRGPAAQQVQRDHRRGVGERGRPLVGHRPGTTAHIEPSSSPPIRIGTISRGSVPSFCAGTKIVVRPRDSSRNTPRDRNRASTSSGTRRPMIVDTRAGSVRSWRAE